MIDDVQLPRMWNWKCGNALEKKKKRSFWRSTIFDHLPPCGLGDYILHSPLFTTDCKPQHRVTSIATAFGPPNFQMEITPCNGLEHVMVGA